MGNGNKLLKDTLMYGVANFCSGILTFLMLPLYTHYFTTAEYGFWELVVTTSTLLAPFITIELVAADHRWLLIEKNEEKQKPIITTGAFTIMRNLLFFNVITIIRSEEHTSELQSRFDLVCRLLLEKKKNKK